MNSMVLPVVSRFPYWGTVYEIRAPYMVPSEYIVLKSRNVIMVVPERAWSNKVPGSFNDVFKIPQGMTVGEAALILRGVIAEEVPGADPTPYDLIQFFGQSYKVEADPSGLVEFPDGSLYGLGAYYPGPPRRYIGEKIKPYDSNDSYMPYQLETWGKTPAILVDDDYPGMSRAPWDMRIYFSLDGEEFVVTHDVYDKGQGTIFVEDKGFYRVGGFFETSPVQLASLTPVHYAGDTSRIPVALRVENAVDAKEKRK